MQAPCKDCPIRSVGCHEHCDEYLKFKAFREAFRAQKFEESEKNWGFFSSTRNYKYWRRGK